MPIITFLIALLVFTAGCAHSAKYQHHVAQGNSFVRKKLYNEAISHYKLAIKSHKDPYVAQTNLGIVYAKIGDCVNTIYLLKTVANQHKELYEPNFYLARCYTKLGQLKKALKYVNRAQTIKPGDPRVLTLKSWLFYLKGNTKNSLQVISHVIRSNPELIAARIIKAKNYMSRQNPDLDQAKDTLVKAMQKATKLVDKSYVYSALGELYNKSHNIKKSKFYYQKSLESRPFDYDSLVGLGEINIRQNKLEEALNLLNQAAKVNGSAPLAYYHLGRIFLKRNPVKSAYYFKKFITLSKNQYTFRNQIKKSKLILKGRGKK